MANYSEKWLEELINKVDIVSVIQEFVFLQKKGKKFEACCPFHNEKTPSFSVNPEQKFYYCYGCHKSGNAITFLIEYQNMSFVEAVEWLANKVGFKLPDEPEDKEAAKKKEYRQKLVEVNRVAAEYYFNNFKNPESTVALDYLRKRGLLDSAIVKFGIGYSPNNEGLFNSLSSKGYSEKTMIEAGLINETTKSDFFARRIVIPIINIKGDVVGFGGRAVNPNDVPKYKNTPKTYLFDKKYNLFGLNLIQKLKKERHEFNSLILLEGYMDVITLNQAGIVNVVASMGTSLTNEQCDMIRKLVSNVYVCYDGDTAGKAATWRSLDILSSKNLEVKVVSVPDNMDPDDYINKFGVSEFEKLISKALPLLEYKIRTFEKQSDLQTIEGRSKFVNLTIPVLRELDPVSLSLYSELVSSISSVNQEFIIEKVKSKDIEDIPEPSKPENFDSQEKSAKQSLPQNLGNPLKEARKFLLAACFLNTKYFNTEDLKEVYFDGDNDQRKIYDYCVVKLEKTQTPIIGDLISESDTIESELLSIEAIMQYLDEDIDAENKYNSCINKLNIDYLTKKISNLVDAICSETNELVKIKKSEDLKRYKDLLKRSVYDRKRRDD